MDKITDGPPMIENLPDADKIIFHTVCKLPPGKPIAIEEIAYRSCFHRNSVAASLQRLAQLQLIRRYRRSIGLAYSYEVTHAIPHS